jgi:hypothetical protein
MGGEMVLDAIYGASQAWSFVNPITLVQSWRKLLPDLQDDDLQGFPNKENSKSEILDTVYAIRSSKNTDEHNEEWPQSDVCEVGFQHMTDIVNAAAKQTGEEDGGEDKSEICTAMRRSLNSSQKQVTNTSYSQNKHNLYKKKSNL